MTAAARKAVRSLKRDYGEVENLQVSMKGPANFRHRGDRRAEDDFARGARQGEARLQFFSARKAAVRAGDDKSTLLDRRPRSTETTISCMASRNSQFRLHSSATA